MNKINALSANFVKPGNPSEESEFFSQSFKNFCLNWQEELSLSVELMFYSVRHKVTKDRAAAAGKDVKQEHEKKVN